MAARTTYKATNPQRIFDEAKECRYFLNRMTDHEKARTTDEFMFCLGAFLKSFRSIAYRLYGVVEIQRGYGQMKALENQLKTHPRIGVLIDRANLEVHGDGAVIWKRYNVSISDDMQQKHQPRLRSRFGDPLRWMPRLQSRFQPATVRMQTVVATDWQFAGNPTSLIELCRNGLDEIEMFVNQSISFLQQTP
jgi:hypothetical protein